MLAVYCAPPAPACLCPTQLGDKATFTWAYTGLDTGRHNCTIEGGSTVALAGACTSPLIYTVRTTLNQTLSIAYQDVCGERHNASLTFGPRFGWEVEAKELGTSSLHKLATTSGGPGATLQLKPNGAGSSATGGALAAVLRCGLALLAAALLAGLML